MIWGKFEQNYFSMKPTIGVYLFEGFSDWEMSYVLPELKKLAHLKIEFVTESGKPVSSMGGMTVVPTLKYADLAKNELAMLIIPGGTLWESTAIEQLAIYQDIKTLAAGGCTIAAICGATLLLGKTGLLANMMHTSNDLNYLKAFVPNYASDDLYLHEPCITDNRLITASGISPIEFARNILLQLNVDAEYVARWYKLFSLGIWVEA